MYQHDHQHHDTHGSRSLNRALWITAGFALIEALAGWQAHSLALLSDAGHMLTDASALALAALAAMFARRPASRRHSWGMGRVEILVALFNGATMLLLALGIAYGAIQRIQQPEPVAGGIVLVTAAIGFVINLAVLKTLSHAGHAAHHHPDHAHHDAQHHPTAAPDNLNLRGASLHVLGDLLGSVAALASGAVIYVTGWMLIDPILSLLICGLMLVSSLRLLRDGAHVVMEGVPRHLDLNRIGAAMAHVPQVVAIHDLHIWQISSERIALSAHVVLRQLDDWLPVLATLNRLLCDQYHIDHATLQPELLTSEPSSPPRAAKCAMTFTAAR